MNRADFTSLKDLEGRRVSVALVDGSRIDDCCVLVVLPGARGRLWVHSNGRDVLLLAARVREVWEATAA